MRKQPLLKTLLASVVSIVMIGPWTTFASDHDDGITTLKPMNRNLTDLYLFREDNQTGNPTDNKNMVFVMNTNPRSTPGVEQTFSTSSTYEFQIAEIAGTEKNSTPDGIADYVIQMKFDAPEINGQQPFTVTLTNKVTGAVTSLNGEGAKFMTTNIKKSMSDSLVINQASIANGTAKVFAGLREDPFFFDVDQFFRVRLGAAGVIPKEGFLPANKATDFTKGYNVNSIVVSLPIAALQSDPNNTVFDVWETITATSGGQVERLGRPAINEGLVLSNDFLNAFNSIPPNADLSSAAAPVVAEASATLDAFDGIDGKEDVTVAAVATAFLPDVMRIDSTLSIPLNKAAYNSDVSGDKGMLTGGRKIEDDVMDITVSFLVAGDATGMAVQDGTSYAGTPGNPNQGHRKLYKQAGRMGPAQFPFLARPN